MFYQSHLDKCQLKLATRKVPSAPTIFREVERKFTELGPASLKPSPIPEPLGIRALRAKWPCRAVAGAWESNAKFQETQFSRGASGLMVVGRFSW